MDTRAVADLKQLAERDGRLAARGDELRNLDTRVAALRARAEAIDEFFAAYPGEEARRRKAALDAEAELARRRTKLAAAEQELAAAGDTDARDRAESAVRRATDHVSVAAAAFERVRAEADELERAASALPREVPELEARAGAIAARADAVPPAPSGVRELVEWAQRAHAELFVAAGQLASERDRVIREANELATMLLGEPTYGSTVARLAQRVLPLAGE